MTIFEDNMKRWREKSAEAIEAWHTRHRVRPSVLFVTTEVPTMLRQFEADTETIERRGVIIREQRILSAILFDALTDLLDLVGDPDPDAYADGISYGHAVEVVERAKAALAKAGGE